MDRSRNSNRGNSSSEIEWPCGTTRSGRSSRDKTFFQDEPDAEDIIDSLVPLFAIVSPFLIAFLIVFFYIYYRNKKVQSRYRVMEKAIESGRELPEGFFDEPESKRPSKFSTLNQGLVCTAVGIGSFIWCIGGAYELDGLFWLVWRLYSL